MGILKFMFKDGKSAFNNIEKVNLLNDFFHSVYFFKENFKVEDIQPENPTLTYFNVTPKRNLSKSNRIRRHEIEGP